MRIEHPLAGEGSGVAPGAVDVHGETVSLDEDGRFDVDDEGWLKRFADRYDADPGNIVVDDEDDVGTISHEELIATVESGTVDEITEAVEAGDFDPALEELQQVEADRDDRKGVRDAIEARRDELEG